LGGVRRPLPPGAPPSSTAAACGAPRGSGGVTVAVGGAGVEAEGAGEGAAASPLVVAAAGRSGLREGDQGSGRRVA